MSQTWIIKDTAPVDGASLTLATTNISFTTNNQKETSIGIEDQGGVYVLVYSGIGDVAGYDPGLDPAFVWNNEAYKTLEFDTTPTGELLAWLQKNADKQVDTEYLTRKSELTSVANAIRAKGGTSDSLVYPDGFVTAIQDIQTGTELQIIVTVTSGATVTATKGSLSVSGTSVNGTCTLTVPEAGTWSVSATLNGQTSNTKTVSITDTYMVSLTFFSATITVTVDSGASVALKKDGATIQTKTSTGTVVFTVTETGIYTIVATKNGKTTSSSVNVVSSTTSYSLTLSFISSTLNNNEWSVIKSVSDAGQGANYWSIGDRKEVTLNGTVGHLTLSNYTTYAFIIGFNHNASVEGANRIHFQFAKTALSGGADVCLCDSKYAPDNGWSSAGAGYFAMNASDTNSGGWKSSQMRTNICGTNLSSYSGTIIAVIPAALRAVLKSVTKYTDNTANGGGSTASYVTATTDYFFLLSEFEVFGRISYGNSNEKNKQAQYAYYSAGNSKIKHKHNSTSTAVLWWLRSPPQSISSGFVSVGTGGGVTTAAAYGSIGFAPGFCV